MNIYLLRNKATNKSFVGLSTGNMSRVRTRFVNDAKRFGIREEPGSIWADILLHGIQNVTITLIESCPDEMAQERRQLWIDYLNTSKPKGYNHNGA